VGKITHGKTNNRVIYKCGCEAAGDNIATFCPIHGDPIVENKKDADILRVMQYCKEIKNLGKEIDIKRERKIMLSEKIEEITYKFARSMLSDE